MSENEQTAAEVHAQSLRTLADAMVRWVLWPVVATVACCAVVASVVVGVAGLVGALTGGAVGAVSTALTLVLMRKTAQHGPMQAMAASMGGLLLKMAVLLPVMMALRGVAAVHSLSLAFTLLAVILVSAAAEVWAFRRTPLPTIVPADKSEN